MTDLEGNTLPSVRGAKDMKAVIILTACDIMQKLLDMGDRDGAFALKCLVETIETIPCSPDS